MGWVVLAPVVIAAAAVGWRGTRMRMVVVGGLAVVLLTAVALIRTDYRDAGDFMGCWPACTTLQDTVGFVFFVAPVTLVCVVLAGLAAAAVKQRNAS